jgi:signal transduction histidine kinase
MRRAVAELEASRSRLALAQESDRRRIERELHEGPQQHLVALAVNLQRARELVDSDSAAAGDLIDEMGRDVQVALEETARLAHRIHPPLLDAGGLAAALREAAVGTGVKARIKVDPEALAEAENAGVVYFCCLEALECAGSGAGVSIDVRVEDGLLVFEVTDDGAVTDVDGYEGMRDRVEALGGRLTAGSKPDGVNRMCGALPLRR